MSVKLKLLLFVSGFTALGVVLLILFPQIIFPSGSDTSSTSTSSPVSFTESTVNDAKYRIDVLGTWKDNFMGKRTMTLNKDNTGVMLIELEGAGAILFADRLKFNMTWSINNGRLKKKTISGDPPDKVNLVLKALGDTVNEPILELNKERLILLDKNGTRKYNWTR